MQILHSARASEILSCSFIAAFDLNANGVLRYAVVMFYQRGNVHSVGYHGHVLNYRIISIKNYPTHQIIAIYYIFVNKLRQCFYLNIINNRIQSGPSLLFF
jgi:hypothetical protein